MASAAPTVTALTRRVAGSPHTQHYVNARDALQAGKHVLCEKPVTVTAAELRALLALAAEKKRFFMEAMWTRFQPVAAALKKAAEDPRLGDIRVVCVPLRPSGECSHLRAVARRQADLSGDFDIHSAFMAALLRGVLPADLRWPDLPLTHRILDPKLGGGALLDLFVSSGLRHNY